MLAALGAVLNLAGSVILAVDPVAQGLDRPLLGTTARALLTGVLLDPAHPGHLDPSLLDPATAVHRLGYLLRNLAAAPGATITLDGALTLGPHARTDGTSTVYGLTLGLSGPWKLGGDDITVSLEPDAAWIVPPPAGTPGITVEVLSLDAAGNPAPAPGIGVDGVAIRLARTSGALLDSVITIESVALSLFADILGADGTVTASGGAKLELAGLSAALGGASGDGSSGGNAVASGLMNSGGHDDAPKPRFSPALAIQKHGTDAAFVTFTAGDGTGPWWVVIQRGFGPIYIEQVGLAVTMAQGQVSSVGLLIDGKVSLLGLTASVDDLSITYLAAMGSPLDPNHWSVDLAGLAVTADLAGLSLAGGLRKFPVAEGGVQYLGMLLAKLAVYGISVYGGYGLVGPPGDQYASLFLFGAVNGPIGGPPAFFVTGIGGGFGINRDLIYPSDLTQFPSYPFIKALDPAARPGDPMTELDQVRGFFPPDRGSFWFAAGVSFTAFALVDGVAVIAVQIGDGFELALLGLARMALPRPQAALVSIELALLARVSTKEGVVLVQAALTDNSWLLYPDIRLTGGFAFASWFGGPNRGQMVLTLGGYHPDFHRDGYPVVPRLGLSINLFGFLSITGQTYFALTSEAVMAGVDDHRQRRLRHRLGAPALRRRRDHLLRPVLAAHQRVRVDQRGDHDRRLDRHDHHLGVAVRTGGRVRATVLRRGHVLGRPVLADRPVRRPAAPAARAGDLLGRFRAEVPPGGQRRDRARPGRDHRARRPGPGRVGGLRRRAQPRRQRRQPLPGHPRVHPDRHQPGPGPHADRRRHHHEPADRARGVRRAHAPAGPAHGHARPHRPVPRQPAGQDRRADPGAAAGRLVPDRGLGPGPNPGRRQDTGRRRDHRRGPHAADRLGPVGAKPRRRPRHPAAPGADRQQAAAAVRHRRLGQPADRTEPGRRPAAPAPSPRPAQPGS